MVESDGVQEYHKRFGHPTHNDTELFELLTVGIFQAGLSWKASASKLPVFRQVFFNFDIKKVAALNPEDLSIPMNNPDMIHNNRKIKAVIIDARAVLKVQSEFGSFSKYLWSFTDNQPKLVDGALEDQLANNQSFIQNIVKDLKRRGFTFVGPIVTMMFLRAAGIVQSVN
ncbi:DNA-3-methyladenine glycosylase I [Pediococcus claussenii]|uniref:Methyladenine glycosylase family protein n=1 Tax=Pediococcus claussenii (strain ATCC BAA-344 / DSM 14800 / JCM 18046 / KCTC 3811 / LMG 21948 / P06) TaxID=701521 RepID=G8PA69_PEDCP|nr:DNA-3-methyladenine glycosylase I [Pediococcus claussenii]AEV94508.1 methyladenine glycosylase family protein [Pediococcus claussenii ATCC BAA-344]ANZ69725.1 methyladenine glycosylase [Pediococcus claussenii]ANZ71542.1 methyladenine glycosylase [Pediococcus claussenii]KRN19785.1 hypothetical protein IV79_GL001073 [Pediococcus claussenii]